MKMVQLCKAGTEVFLGRELALSDQQVSAQGNGWLQVSDGVECDLCFAHTSFKDLEEINGTSVNSLVAELCLYFGKKVHGQRINKPWPLFFAAAPQPQLSARASLLQREWLKIMRKKMSRVIDLAVPWGRETQWQQGFYVFCADFNRVFAGSSLRSWGQQRMKFDANAPSRSYLKAEEAYRILGREPAANETAADLGAAPGGWSYSAAKRGAKVWAIDNGPLKKGALGNPRIRHLRCDAFNFKPEVEEFDWLLCDIIDDPHRTIELLGKWLRNRWCRLFIVNLKYGRRDPVALLQKVRNSEMIAPFCETLLVRHLYHDREEITVVGQVK